MSLRRSRAEVLSMENVIDVTHELSRSWEKFDLNLSIEDRRELFRWLSEAQDDSNLVGRTKAVVDLARA